MKLLLEFPEGEREVRVAEGDGRPLSVLLSEAGVSLNLRCGGRGLCSGCVVDLLEGELETDTGTVRAPASLRSCTARLSGPGSLRLRPHLRALLGRNPSVVASYSVTAPCEVRPWVAIAKGFKDLGFAIDLGTTTVVVALVDLGTGAVLGQSGAYNAQVAFGDNVLTRIQLAGTPGGLEALRLVLVKDTLLPLLKRVCRETGHSLSHLACGMVAGNTTMLHLLTGEDPSGMGLAPFTPRFLEMREISAGVLGLCEAASALDPALPVRLLPGYSAFVGADIVAGVWATGMLLDDRPSVLVDIGTNGEMALHADGRLWVCATAAGPAFEGSGLLAGTRAQEGAISRVRASEPLSFDLEVLGHGGRASALGLCGTAYLDFMAEGRRTGLLTPQGRFAPSMLASAPGGVFHPTPHGRALSLVGGGNPLVGEQDLASLMQAKAALASGLEILLLSAGLAPSDLGCLYLAGGFGLHLDLHSALGVGLFPGFRREQLRVVGNTALAGAIMALVDAQVLSAMEATRTQSTVVELNSHPEFEDRFIDALFLP